MNKNNSKINKKIKSITLLILVILACGYPVYVVNSKIRNYRAEVLGDYTKLAELESEKGILDIYNKILLKGSKESIEIQKRILSSDRKEVLELINTFEAYAKKTSLAEGGASPIVSVSTRENASLSKLNAVDLVVSMRVAGNEKDVDTFIQMMDSLPLMSYLEKVDVQYDPITRKNTALITLVIYQMK